MDKKTHLIKSCLKTEKKKKYKNEKNLYINHYLKDCLEIELIPEEVLISFTVSDAYASLRVRHNYLNQKVGRTQNI